MVLNTDLGLIRQVPLFSALPLGEIRYLSETLRRTEVPAGVLLFQEGDPGDRFSVILEGEIEIIKSLGTADERLLAVAQPGDFLGEMSLFYRDGLRSASARTLIPAQLLELTQSDFDALLNRQPALALKILREMVVRVRDRETSAIRILQEKNLQLTEAYQELQAAQAQLIEKEKIEHELQVARKIQEQTLPKELPVIPGWQVAAFWQPARAVSGDFYDFVSLPDGRLGIIIGDVSGKGVPAALVMATTRSVLHTVAEQWETPPEVLAKVNNGLCRDMPANMFVTCLYAILDPKTGGLRFSNAGHNLPYLRRGDQAVELRARGMPLGLLPDMRYEEKETRLEPGDCLLMFSDGLVEAHNRQNEIFGFPRLHQQLNSYAASVLDEGGGPRSTGASLITNLLDELAAFTGPDWEQEDDVTFVTLERLQRI